MPGAVRSRGILGCPRSGHRRTQADTGVRSRGDAPHYRPKRTPADSPIGKEPVGKEPVGKEPVGKEPVGKEPVRPVRTGPRGGSPYVRTGRFRPAVRRTGRRTRVRFGAVIDSRAPTDPAGSGPPGRR